MPRPVAGFRARTYAGRSPASSNVAQQLRRLRPQFAVLERLLGAEGARLAPSAEGASPEHVLVLELKTRMQEFLETASRLGMESLAGYDIEEFEFDPELDDPEHGPTGGRLYLFMSNQRAIGQLLKLWHDFETDENVRFPWGQGKWREIFRDLRRIRLWDAEDRLAETGVLQDWSERLRRGEESIRFEAEFWYRTETLLRQRAEERFAAAVHEARGEIIRRAAIPEIRYHAALAQLPAAEVRRVLEPNLELAWIQSREVMFFQAVGQSVSSPAEAAVDVIGGREGLPLLPPRVALFDGLPVANHVLLADRLRIDDPEGWTTTEQAEDRLHGTAMAGAIIHGDLSAPSSVIRSQLYVRPIMRRRRVPSFENVNEEAIPETELPVDLIVRSTRRLFEKGANGEEPVAPTVRIISLSIGDRYRQFVRTLSPWAKAIDWLSWQYGVLFVISAGNHTGPLALDLPAREWDQRTPDEIEVAVLKAVSQSSRNRRLLSPAESVNAATVGAGHADASADPGQLVNPIQGTDLFSPISALGLGYRRSVKPDVLVPGGRVTYQRPLPGQHPPQLTVYTGIRAPGVQVAAPGSGGAVNRTRFERGTSLATAIAAGEACRILELVDQIRVERGSEGIEAAYDAVLAKCLLVHTATWRTAFARMGPVLRGPGVRNLREHATRFVGYGFPDADRLHTRSDARVTLLRAEVIHADQSHRYDIPLPESLGGLTEWRRLTVTLAWISPIAPARQAYRSAAVYADYDERVLGVETSDIDRRTTRRGTVQHEVIEGRQVVPIAAGASLSVTVSCREEGDGLHAPVPYSLAVSIETRVEATLPVYQEVRARTAVPVRVT